MQTTIRQAITETVAERARYGTLTVANVAQVGAGIANALEHEFELEGADDGALFVDLLGADLLHDIVDDAVEFAVDYFAA